MSIFTKVQTSKPKRNVFDLSHEIKLTAELGSLVPIFCQEVLPGDSFRVNTSSLVRMAPMIAPIMQRLNVYTHFFFVPNRILWDDWETFITGGPDGSGLKPTDGGAMPFPREAPIAGQFGVGSLCDYMGVPTPEYVFGDQVKTQYSGRPVVNALPFRAYQLIWNEYYRDQNLTDPFDIHPEIWSSNELTGLPDNEAGKYITGLFKLRSRAWHKDYFTSALPWTQRGEEATFPLGGTAPVSVNGLSSSVGVTALIDKSSGKPVNVINPLDYPLDVTRAGSSYPYQIEAKDSAGNKSYYAQLSTPSQSLSGTADLSSATAVTINELRRANALQVWLEKNARGGARYIEQILSHFGVRVADYRLQRPEFLGGGKSPIMISEVLQNSESATTPQGNMSGHGLSASSNHAFKAHFYEHGFVIGIMSILPYSSYQQGLPKIFKKFDKLDYAFPEFANLGEQPILNSELYYSNNSSDSETFGYTPRYAEYKYCPDSVHGDFRTSLNFWHQGRIFDSAPALNEDFVTCDDPNLNRIFAVQGTEEQRYDHFWIQIYNDVRAIRPLPKYGTPSL